MALLGWDRKVGSCVGAVGPGRAARCWEEWIMGILGYFNGALRFAAGLHFGSSG